MNTTMRAMMLGIGVAGIAVPVGASAQTHAFDIPAATLTSALRTYIRQSGTQLIFRADELRGRRTAGVRGTMSSEAALGILLHGSGFGTRKDPSGAIAIVRTPSVAAGGSELDPPSVDDVVVTATKRETSLMRTPLAVTALSQDDLNRAGANDLRGLEKLAPGLILAENGRNGALEVSLRGIYSSNDTEFGSPSVGIYQDGVYLPRSQGAFTLLQDVERVEIARGPQGTIFGKNSTVGAINIIAKRPDLTAIGGTLSAGIGNYNEKEVHATINVPIIRDLLALRGSYARVRRDGWINQYPDRTDFDGDGVVNVDQRFNRPVESKDYYYNRNAEAFRIAALLKPSDRFNVYAAYDVFVDHSAGSVALKNCGLAANTPGACPAGDRFQPVPINVPGDRNGHDKLFRAIADWTPFDGVEAVYIFGAERMRYNPVTDVDAGQSRFNAWTGTYGTNGQPVYFGNFAEDRYLRNVDSFTNERSHEVQLKSAGAHRFSWILGGYYTRETGQVRQFNEEPTSYGFDTPTAINGPLAYNFLTNGIDIQSKAVFGQVDYKVFPDLTLTAGVRHTWDRNSYQYEAAYTNSNPVNPGLYFDPVHPAPGDGGLWYEAPDFQAATRGLTDYPIDTSTPGDKIKFSRTTWRLGLDYRARGLADTFFYGYVARGYKGGNWTIPIPELFVDFQPARFLTFQARPETVTTYEVGAKGTYLNGRLSLRSALYYSNYVDYQLFDFVNVTLRFTLSNNGNPITLFTVPIRPLVTQNIGSVHMWGWENEFSYLAWKGGRFSGNLTLEQNHIADFNPVAYSQNWFCGIRDARPDLSDCSNQSLTGNRLPRTPKVTVNATYAQDVPVGDVVLQPSATLSYRSSFFQNITNFDEGEFSSKEPGALLIDANIRLATAKANWTVDLWVHNLTNRQQMIGQNVGPAQAGAAGDLGYVVGEFTDPRTFGVRVGTRF